MNSASLKGSCPRVMALLNAYDYYFHNPHPPLFFVNYHRAHTAFQLRPVRALHYPRLPSARGLQGTAVGG